MIFVIVGKKNFINVQLQFDIQPRVRIVTNMRVNRWHEIIISTSIIKSMINITESHLHCRIGYPLIVIRAIDDVTEVYRCMLTRNPKQSLIHKHYQSTQTAYGYITYIRPSIPLFSFDFKEHICGICTDEIVWIQLH